MGGALAWILGSYELIRLAAKSRFRVRGPYWSWRWYTGFGRGAPASRTELLAAALRYGRWMGRMRRMR